MQSMKRQTATTGRNLQSAISRNLSLSCPNHSPTFMRRTSCCSFSQTISKKSMVWNAYQHCTIISERQITISILFFQNGNCPQKSLIQSRYNRRCRCKNLSANHPKKKHRPSRRYRWGLSCQPKQPSIQNYLRFTKKGELQSKIDRKNEEIDILKIGLSGIAKRYGYQNVQEFYRIYHKSYSAYIAHKEQVAKWEKTYKDDNQKQNKESMLERLMNPPKRTADYQQQETLKGKDRGARQSFGLC